MEGGVAPAPPADVDVRRCVEESAVAVASGAPQAALLEEHKDDARYAFLRGEVGAASRHRLWFDYLREGLMRREPLVRLIERAVESRRQRRMAEPFGIDVMLPAQEAVWQAMLVSMDGTSAAVAAATAWLIDHDDCAAAAAAALAARACDEHTHPQQRVFLVYLCSSVLLALAKLQTQERPAAGSITLLQAIQAVCPSIVNAAIRTAAREDADTIRRVVEMWRDRRIVDSATSAALTDALDPSARLAPPPLPPLRGPSPPAAPVRAASATMRAAFPVSSGLSSSHSGIDDLPAGRLATLIRSALLANAVPYAPIDAPSVRLAVVPAPEPARIDARVEELFRTIRRDEQRPRTRSRGRSRSRSRSRERGWSARGHRGRRGSGHGPRSRSRSRSPPSRTQHGSRSY
mmetsp:Transcript_14342/g.49867  ORF Transcript_14342/g.49867 Transcript_14342/m.49867 type:complete len:404 (+) Transcript_14342:111-1322(+)